MMREAQLCPIWWWWCVWGVGGGVAIISHAPSAGGWVPGATAAGWRVTGRALELSPYGFPWLQIDAGSPLGWVLYLYCLLEKQWALGIGWGGGGGVRGGAPYRSRLQQGPMCPALRIPDPAAGAERWGRGGQPW